MKTVTKFCLKMVQNYLPDAFILAILLTFVVFCGGMFLMNKSALQMIEYWGRGYFIDVCFWDADGFSFIDRLCTGIDTFG